MGQLGSSGNQCPDGRALSPNGLSSRRLLQAATQVWKERVLIVKACWPLSNGSREVVRCLSTGYTFAKVLERLGPFGPCSLEEWVVRIW